MTRAPRITAHRPLPPLSLSGPLLPTIPCGLWVTSPRLWTDHLTLLPHLWGRGGSGWHFKEAMRWLSSDCCGPLDSFHLISRAKTSGELGGRQMECYRKNKQLLPSMGWASFAFPLSLFKQRWDSLAIFTQLQNTTKTRQCSPVFHQSNGSVLKLIYLNHFHFNTLNITQSK